MAVLSQLQIAPQNMVALELAYTTLLANSSLFRPFVPSVAHAQRNHREHFTVYVNRLDLVTMFV